MENARRPNEHERWDEQTRRLVFLAFCTAFGLVCSYVEALLPLQLGVPGAKPGLPNIVTVMLLYCVGTKEALFVTLARILLSGFMFGNLFAIVYALAGAACSFLVMLALKKTERFSMTGVSAAGGVAHNLGQLAAAACLTNRSVFAYLPALVMAGTAAGVVVGILSGIISRRIAGMLRKMI